MSTISPASVNSSGIQAQGGQTAVEDILGAAIFDLSGLPQEYFITPDHETTSWIQIVFQALGLKPLIASSLDLEGFHHITINLSQKTAIVVRGKTQYLAVLLSGNRQFYTTEDAHRFHQWVRQFEQTTLRQNPRFKSV